MDRPPELPDWVRSIDGEVVGYEVVELEPPDWLRPVDGEVVEYEVVELEPAIIVEIPDGGVGHAGLAAPVLVGLAVVLVVALRVCLRRARATP